MFVKSTTTLSAVLMDVDCQRSGTGYLIARTIFSNGDWTANDCCSVVKPSNGFFVTEAMGAKLVDWLVICAG